MSLEDQVREAFIGELKRQAEIRPGELRVSEQGDARLTVDGVIDLDELEMALVGAVAGGP